MVRHYVLSRNLMNEEVLAHWEGGCRHKFKKLLLVSTFEKLTTRMDGTQNFKVIRMKMFKTIVLSFRKNYRILSTVTL